MLGHPFVVESPDALRTTVAELGERLRAAAAQGDPARPLEVLVHGSRAT